MLSLRISCARIALFSAALLVFATPCSAFDYASVISAQPQTLSVWIQDLAVDGRVTVNGADSSQLIQPFVFDWGDGSASSGFFPQDHKYADAGRNYIVTVTATHQVGGTQTASAAAAFVFPVFTQIAIAPDYAVSIPAQPVALVGFANSGTLVAFDDIVFSAIRRSDAEYVLGVAAAVERDLANGNFLRIDGGFRQVVLKDPGSSNGYAVWFSHPVGVGLASVFMSPTIQWSSIFHEMGHNITLNSPSSFTYGPAIGGSANAIFSESMAQIFQHVAGFEVVNNAPSYGIPDEVVLGIQNSLLGSARFTRSQYDSYLASGKTYVDWNNGGAADATLQTFTTVAYKFIQHGQIEGLGYRIPLKRMMTLLQTFDAGLAARFAPSTNSLQASTFRSTLMVTAMSYAFSRDLRPEFTALNFPIDNATYVELMGRVSQTHTAQNDVADCVFAWGESTYPSYFNPAPSASSVFATYYYRYYAGSGTYLGTSSSDGHLYIALSSSLIDLGPLSGWLAASGCR